VYQPIAGRQSSELSDRLDVAAKSGVWQRDALCAAGILRKRFVLL
jgi:hypothetical protein